VVKSVPALNTLVLTQNNVAELADLEVLRGFKKLTFVSLVDNPVANKEVRTESSVGMERSIDLA